MDNRHLLQDLKIELKQQQFRPVYRVREDRRPAPGGVGQIRDLGTIVGRDNLSQAVIMRLLTPRGELTALGHPEYGSRLHVLIGQVNTDTIRNLVKLHILESLKREPRIAKSTVEVTLSPGRRSSVDVRLQVTPIGSTDVVTIGPLTLELGP